MTGAPLHNFAGHAALVLHRSEDVRHRLSERLQRLGMRMVEGDDENRPGAFGPESVPDVIIIDIDRAYDEQLPWPAGQAELPIIGLVGSESPGRLAWALRHGVDAYLPLSASGYLFSALVIAHEAFRKKQEAREREAREASRKSGRLDLIRAVNLLMQETGDDALALKKLRALAMVDRISVEEAAAVLLAKDAPHWSSGR